MSNIYVGSTKWSAVTPWAASAPVSVGDRRRQLATPTVGNERVWRCTTAGTTGGSEPSWTLTAGSTTNDNGVVWTEITGQAAHNGDGGGSAWGAPHARLANAFASGWGAAGDNFYVSNNHAETAAVNTALTCPGTPASPCMILCINDAASLPATAGDLTTGASVSTTGAFAISTAGYFYNYGVNINSGTTGGNITASNDNVGFFESCSINLSNNSGSANINYPGNLSNKNSYAHFRNCSFNFGNIAQKIQPTYGSMDFVGCTFAATGSVPTALFGPGLAAGPCRVRDSDLSAISGSLVNVATSANIEFQFENCKTHASMTPTTGSYPSLGGCSVKIHNYGNTATNYKFFESNYTGSVTHETTIVRSGGASDGTTAESHKIVSTANAKFITPFRSMELVKWNAAVGSPLTATVEIASGGTLTDGDIWMEVEYLGDASSPKASVASNRKATVLTTAANHTTSAETWASSPGTTQKLQVTFTPQQAGPVKVRIYVGKASATIYIDPVITLA